MRRRQELTVRHTIELRPTAPFNFDATVHKPDYFPTPDGDWQPGIAWQTMLWRGVRLGLRMENRGALARPQIRLTVWARRRLDRRFLHSVRDEITYRYNLQRDLTGFNRRFRTDPQLGPVIRKWRGMRPSNYCSLYEGIIVMIALQNCTVRRSVSMMCALFDRYGTLLRYDGKELYCYWPPEVMDRATEPELRELKVGYRAKNIMRITAAFARAGCDEMALRHQPREEQRQALLDLYGIGPATVGHIVDWPCIAGARITHLPPWEQRIYSKLLFDVDPETPVPVAQILDRLDTRFGEHQTLALHYLWEDLWWRRKRRPIPWLEPLIRL